MRKCTGFECRVIEDSIGDHQTKQAGNGNDAPHQTPCRPQSCEHAAVQNAAMPANVASMATTR